MLPTHLALTLIVASALLAQAAPPDTISLYVATDGNDAWSGRSPRPAGPDGPFRTLQRAQEEARRVLRQIPRHAVTIYVRGGIYELPAALTLGPEDSGSSNFPVTWRAYPEETPRLVGARRISGFTPYKGSILQCSLKGTPLEKTAFRALFFGGQRMTLARSPNTDPDDPHGGEWAYVASVPGDNVHDRFVAFPGFVKPWRNPQEATLCIFSGYDWAWSMVPVKAADPTTAEIQLARDTWGPLRVGDRFFIENLLEELDAPGEWYLDRTSATLYFWPPADIASADALAPVTPNVVVIKGARHIALRGFVIEACDGDAVVIEDSEECAVQGCTVRNAAAWGIRISGGKHCGAFGNDVTSTGAGGISLTGGDRKTLARGDNYATNNYIHHIAAVNRTYATAINCYGVGNLVDHNLIHDTPHAGMTLSGNDNVVEYNIVHHTNLQSADTGGIYFCSRDWTQRGNVIRFNIFHHCGGFGKLNSWAPVSQGKVEFVYPGFTWGIYLDDPTTGTTVYGNVLWSVPICALHNHGGRDNTWENNIIVDCPAINEGMLASDWSEWPSIYNKLRAARYPGSPYLEKYPELAGYADTRPEEMTGVRFVRNIVYYTEEGTRWLRERRAKDWQGGQLLYDLRMTRADFDKNQWDFNTIFAPPGMDLKIRLNLGPERNGLLSWDEWTKLGADSHSLLADPGFVDAAHHDYRLKPDSPALKLGFQQIPLDKIGPYADDRRATWPIVEAPGAARMGEFTTQRFVELPQYARVKATELQVRDGLPNFLPRAATGRSLKLAYFGGGIHPAGGWRAQLLAALRQRYPDSQFTEIDGSICDCVRGSAFSIYRYAHAILDKHPDLVLVDFASDDAEVQDPRQVWRVAEGLVRQTWARDPAIDILFLYAFRDRYAADYAEGLCPMSVSAWEKVATHYGVPAINLGPRVQSLAKENRLVIKAAGVDPASLKDKLVWSNDGVRPSPAGDALYAQIIVESLEKLATMASGDTAARRASLLAATPFTPDHLQNAHLAPITEAMLSPQWRKLPALDPLRVQFARHFDDIWFAHEPGARLTFRFRGTDVSLFDLMGPDTGILRITLDGKDVGRRQQVDPWSYYQRLAAVPIASGLKDAEHEVTVELLPDVPDRRVPMEEAKKVGRFRAEDFQGIAVRLGWIRVVGEVLP